MNERRITAAKPARLRRDVAGFGPVPTEGSPPRPQEETTDAAPVVRVVLIPPDGDGDEEDDRTGGDSRRPDWREW